MPPKRWPGNGHGLPSSRSACTNRTPGIDCGSRSTAITPRFAKTLACRPAPLATSSTGPRVTSGAQRATHGDGSSDACTVFDEQIAQHRTMAASLVFAVAADGKVRLVRQRSKQAEQALGGRRLHFAAVGLGHAVPVLQSAGDELRARREVRKPQVVVVQLGVVVLAHAARGAAYGAEAQP